MTAGLRNFYIFAPQQLAFNSFVLQNHKSRATQDTTNYEDWDGNAAEKNKCLDQLTTTYTKITAAHDADGIYDFEGGFDLQVGRNPDTLNTPQWVNIKILAELRTIQTVTGDAEWKCAYHDVVNDAWVDYGGYPKGGSLYAEFGDPAIPTLDGNSEEGEGLIYTDKIRVWLIATDVGGEGFEESRADLFIYQIFVEEIAKEGG